MSSPHSSDLDRENRGTQKQTGIVGVENSIEDSTQRCGWGDSDPLYTSYHDEEWGVPLYDSQDLFAKLILDGAQAGLSWITILKKREAYYQAFDGLDPEKIAHYDESRVAELLQNKGIVRNRLKIESAIANARAYLDLEDQGISFSQFLWGFVDGRTKQNSWVHLKQVPSKTRESEAMSQALRERGFRFVGPTICYAFMQAVGMVNDHVVDCFRHRELGGINCNR